MSSSISKTAEASFAISQVELLHRRYGATCIGSLGASLLIAAATWQDTESWILISWLSVMWSVLALRGWAAWKFLNTAVDVARHKYHTHRFAVGAAAQGAVWGAAAFLFVTAPDQPSLLFVSVVIGGVSAAAYALYGQVPRVSAAFLALALLPYCIRMTLFGDRFTLLLAALGALHLAVLLTASYYTHRFVRDARLAHERRERYENVRLRVFEQLHGEAPLSETLGLVVEYVETLAPRIRCSVLLLDGNDMRLRLAAAPNLPTTFTKAFDGREIGTGVGSCGTAIRTGEPVLVADVRADPDWIELRAIAQVAGVYSCWSVPIRSAAGTVLGALDFYRDMPGLPDRNKAMLMREASHLAAVAIEHRHAVEQLRAREREFRSLAEHSPDSIARYDSGCRCIYANSQFRRQTGAAECAVLGRTPGESPGGDSGSRFETMLRKVMSSGETEEFELCEPDAEGYERHTHVRLEPEVDDQGRIFQVLAVGRDMTRTVTYRQKLQALAYTDALTGLPNRASLKNYLDEAFMAAARHGHLVTLIMLGLDRFKAVSDTFGRICGDALLNAVGKRLHRSLGSSCVVARLEGDEFAILLQATRDDRSEDVSQRILRALASPFQIGDLEIRLTAGLGIAHAAAPCMESEELLRRATSALHHAKRKGTDQTRRYAPELTSAAQQRLTLEAELRKALDDKAFVLYYQPKVNLVSGEVVGAEALLRWWHPERGLLAPGSFIGIAEESGLIMDIGRWALRSACKSARLWNEGGSQSCRVAVNLSARQFVGGRLADDVQLILNETGCRPEWIELEITESLLLDDDPEIAATLDTLDNLGVSIAIDDFGTGYSALAYLARFPFRTLKIDRSFISGVMTNANSAALVRAIVSMAQSLKLSVVAEGVEEVDQANFLTEIDCHLAQGYLYGHPMPDCMFGALLDAKRFDMIGLPNTLAK